MFSKLFSARNAKAVVAVLAATLALVSINALPARAVNFAAPTFDGLDITSGPDVGGTALHLIGSNWDDVGGITVSFSGTSSVSVSAANVHTDPTNNFSFVDISAPQNLNGGLSQVRVTNSGGAQTGTINYTYYKSFPNYTQTVTEGGSGTVTLTLSASGTCAASSPCNFTPGAVASAVIGGNNLTGLSYNRTSNSSMSVTLPAHTPTNHLTPDVATITVQNTNGYTASSTYTYYQEPNITLPASFTAPVNAPMTPIVLGHPGGPCTSWSTSGSLPVGINWSQGSETISGTTTVAAASGNFSVTCNNPGGTSTATVAFGASKQAQNITAFTLTGATLVSAGNYSMIYGSTAPVIHVTGTTGNPFTVTSNDPAVQVSGNVITITGATTGATLTAHLNETTTHSQSPDVTISLVVNKKDQLITGFVLNGATGSNPSYSAAYGTSGLSYGVTTDPSVGGGTVVVTSDDPCVTIGAGNSVAINCVPNSGAGGTATLTATLAGNANFNGPVTRTLTLAISKGQLGITFTPVNVMVIGGANQNLALHTSLTPAGVGSPYSVSYSIDPASANYCTLQGAIITAIAVGPCVVRAAATGDNNMNTAPIEIRTIDVKFYSAQVLTFSGLSSTYQYGAADVSFAVSDLFGNALVISAPNSPVVAILGSGNSRIMHIIGAGSVQITATDPLTQTAKVFTVTVSQKSVSIGSITANVGPTGAVSFDPALLIGVINGDAVSLDVTQVVATYSSAGTIGWTGKFGLTGANSASYFLAGQPTSILPHPALFSATPGVGSLIGGNQITISGVGFTAGTLVSFGSMAAASVQVLSSTKILIVTPIHNAGTVPILVTVPGFGPLQVPAPFEFKALAPAVHSVEPAASNISGGSGVRIIGENFNNDVVVTLDGAQITVQSVTPNLITFVSPAHAAGSVKLTVTNPGMATTTWEKDFVYSLPVSLDPHATITAWTTGGLRVTITGSNFGPGTSVMVGGVAAVDVQIANDKTINFTIPAVAAAGPANLVVTGADGLPVTLTGVIQYVFAPSLRLVFAAKTSQITTAMARSIARFIKRITASQLQVSALVVSSYTPTSTPGINALATAIARAKSVKTGVKAASKKFTILVNALAASGNKSNQVLITVR